MREQMNEDLFKLPNMAPCDIFVGATASDDEWFSRQAQRTTDGAWSHMLVGFRFEDGNACYFEALMSSGVMGPKSLKKLETWGEESARHRYAIIEIPRAWHPEGGLRPVLDRAMAAVGVQSYSKPQLLAMLLFQRYGVHMQRTPQRTVCSEYVAYVLQGICDLRDRRRSIIDEVNPNSAWRRLMDELTPYGRWTRPLAKASRIAQDALGKREDAEPGQKNSEGMQRHSGEMQRGPTGLEEKAP